MCAALARHGIEHTIVGPPWRVAWPRQLSGDFPGVSWCPGAAHRVVVVVVNDLLARLNEEGVYAQGYADDICLLAVGPSNR